MRASEFIVEGVEEGFLNETTSQLGPQLYTPRPKNLDESMKPDSALWTSTASGSNNGYTSAWVEWAKSEMPQWVGHGGFLYDVSPSARILTINSDRDAMRVANKYGMHTTDIMDLFMYMPWKKIAKDYDAIHHVPSNRGADLFMHSWDVESTAWFNTKMLLNKRKVPILASKKGVTKGSLTSESVEYQEVDEGWKEVAVGGALALGALGGTYTMMKPTAPAPAPQQVQQQVKQFTPLSNNPQNEIALLKTAKASGMKGPELAQFMAQTKHESWDFSRLKEKAQPGVKGYFAKKYDPKFSPKTAKILGNKKVGDGEKYHGRGFIQLTGRDNYRMAGQALNIDLLNNPDLAAEPEVASKIAIWYWNSRVKPHVENFHDTTAVTKKINPAAKGLVDRQSNFKDYMGIV